MFVKSLDYICIVLTDSFLEIGGSFHHIKLLLLTCGFVFFEFMVLLLHVAKFLLVPEVGKSFQSVQLLNELNIILLIVFRM